jgi:polar amino acid transport system permease protein
MPDERMRTEQSLSAKLPSSADDHEPAPPGPYEQFIAVAAGLPWWVIILVLVAGLVLYSMFTSAAYRRVVKSLTDDPQVSTNDLYSVVQVVGEDKMIVGRYVGETADSVETVIDQLLTSVIKTSQVTRSGFIQGETAAVITIRTADGLVTIPKDRVVSETRTETADGTAITVTYVDRITVTGTMTKQNDKTMTIRTVAEQKETFAKSRILSRGPCDPANPDCSAGKVTIVRQGEVITGTLTALSNTNLTVELLGGGTREIRRSDVDYFNVPTLTIALYEPLAGAAVQPGDEVRIGFVEGTDIATALDELNNLNDVPVPLRYADGKARAVLVAYPTIETALAATGAGEVSGMIYLSDGPDRLAVQTWVQDHENAGVVLARPPAECNKACKVTVKLKDDELTGTVENETDDQITVVTTPAEYLVIDKSKILDNRQMKPGVCALNNLRGCNAGIFLTLRVTIAAYFFALIIGLFFGIMRVQRNPAVYAASTLYVEVVRGIPLLVILLYAGFVVSPWLRDHPINLPDFLVSGLNTWVVKPAGLRVWKTILLLAVVLFGWFAIQGVRARSALLVVFWIMAGAVLLFILHLAPSRVASAIRFNLTDEQEAVVGLAFGYGAFVAEIFRAGIQSISRGQMEAARSLGMSYPQSMRYVVLPQAVRVVLPPLGNDFISMLKDSALISVLALPDLLQLGRLYVSRTFRAFEGYNTVAILYLAMTLFLSMMVRVIERRSRLPK